MSTDGRNLRRRRNAARLYDAANALLATRSFDDLSVEEICEHAGVGRATFFRIYETKGGLLREFNRRLTEDAAARIDADDAADLRRRLHHVREAIVDAWRRVGPGHVRMAQEFVRSAPGADPHAAHPELLGLVVAQLAAAVEIGELSDLVPIDLAASLALVHMIAPMAHVLAGRDTDLDRLSMVLLDQWLDGATNSSARAT
jgi:AcrR family transcriptional regulator